MNRYSEHSHILICGLIYPAILGAIIYNIFQGYEQASNIQMLFVIALALLFSFDFLFTADDDSKRIYNPIRLLLDFSLTLLTFKAIDLVIQPDFPASLKTVGLCLFMFKFVSLLWELAGTKNEHWKAAAYFPRNLKSTFPAFSAL